MLRRIKKASNHKAMSEWQQKMAEAARRAGLSPRVDRFFFLRHGQTEYNRKHIVQGWADIPLNFTGEQQAKTAAQSLVKRSINSIITSPLSRARRTAEIVSASIGAPINRLDARLREKSFGDYEHHPDPAPSVWSLLDKNAESYEDFANRCAAAFNEALDTECGLPLIVAHGGVRRILLWGLGIEQVGAHMGNAVPLEFIRVNGVWQVNIVTIPSEAMDSSGTP